MELVVEEPRHAHQTLGMRLGEMLREELLRQAYGLRADLWCQTTAVGDVRREAEVIRLQRQLPISLGQGHLPAGADAVGRDDVADIGVGGFLVA